MNFQSRLERTREALDEVSPSFCLAKWLQVTLHLQSGYNHSCHHPDLHRTPLAELAKDPSALHNTDFKKRQRALMKRGERPEECKFCWRAEDSGERLSDRVIKSADAWASDKLREISTTSARRNINPTYLEVSFGSQCNFQCIYCAAHISSAIWQDYEKNGPFVGRVSLPDLRAAGQAPLAPGEESPYVNAFWRWFPALVKDLRVFRITGGEPLMNSNTFRVLDYLAAHPQPHLELCVNSNLGVNELRLREFLKRINELSAGNKIKKFSLYTSIDTHGRQAEYLRYGLHYEKWLGHVHRYLAGTRWPVVLMSTFTLMSPPRIGLLFRDVFQLNRDFPETEPHAERRKRVALDISPLSYPEYFSFRLLHRRALSQLGSLAKEMHAMSGAHAGAAGFSDYELHKLNRVLLLAKSGALSARYLREQRGIFYTFTEQYKARKGLDFLATFPEMADFYAMCKRAAPDARKS